jgi:VCBS repeat-containing protein
VGSISTLSIAQTEANNTPVTFDWDGTGYQKQTGWVGANDGMLVLDRNFNKSVDSGAELLSNPLVADPAKGLRSLAAFDANADGRIDVLDPVYAQLKVWQDIDQDGNNTHYLQVGSGVEAAQDETNGVQELRSLADWGISAIDYGNSRYEYSKTSDGSDAQYGSMSTQTLEAKDEGVLYSAVEGGIRIDATDGKPMVVVTQVQSEQAVFDQHMLEVAGETIGLNEDGSPTAYNPNTDGGPINIVISAAQLLGNDTWHGLSGVEAGLTINAVSNGQHLGSLALTAEGDISLTLEANYNGAAGFDYTVVSPDGQNHAASVNLNISTVNDVPTVTVVEDSNKAVYGYRTLNYQYTVTTGGGDFSTDTTYKGSVLGKAEYAPFVETFGGEPIYGWEGGGDSGPYWVLQGYTPITQVDHANPIDTDKANSGTIVGADPDGGATLSYEVIGQALHGTAKVDATTGAWTYLGNRPTDIEVPDITGEGVPDWVNAETGEIYANAPRGNTGSNDHSASETSFIDSFTVRVHDGLGGYKDQEVQATHYGPAPVPVVAGSGGKKPIAIDLDGNGFQFTDVNDSNVFMDVNGDGWKQRMAWVKPGDGLLAFDKDANGKIESLDEFAFVGYAPDQQTDLTALRAAFDSNGNGLLDAGDAKWSQFGVWQDANSNGVQEDGEYHTLTDLGITSIGLSSDGQFQVINGQTVYGIATATKADGSTLAVADVSLRTSNEAQVPTVNPDGTSSTSTVVVSKYGQGQVFDGTPDKDLVFGTAASDAFNTGDGDDVIVDDGGNDEVQAGAGNDLIYTGIDNDIINAGAGDDTVFAGAGNDMVFGDGANETGDDVIMLEDGNDVAFGGLGNDFISGGAGNDVLSGNQGDDKLFGEAGWDALFGQDGNDELYGLDGNDLLEAGAGKDLLSGGAGDDSMVGGAGDDTYEVDAAGDSVSEIVDGADTGGFDTVRASVDYSLSDAVEALTLSGTTNLNGTGNTLDNVLVGNAGNNTLTGLAGNDLLDGGQGADTLIGGVGDDSYVLDNAGDQVMEMAGEGIDTVRSRITTTLADNVENLSLLGNYAINGTGNTLDNTLTGNAGNNTLDGGAGNDSYVLSAGGGTDTVQDAAGLDRILVQGNYSAADMVLTRRDQSVIVSLKGTPDTMVLTNWFSDVAGQSSAGQIESIKFENGSTAIDAAYINSLLDNHAPTAVADVAQTQADAPISATGNVLSNDTDVDLPFDSRQHLTISQPGSYAGTYGQLQLNADGSYSYVLDNSLPAVRALAVGETLADTITYTVQDNAVNNKTASATLSITIAGSDDAPVVATTIADQEAREQQAFSFTVPESTFSDIDHDDALNYSALAVSADGSTQALPSWLNFDALTRSFSGTPGSADGGSFDFQVTATDPSGASVSTRFTLDIADEFAGTGDQLNVITGSWMNDTLNGTRRSETLIGNGGTDKLLAGEGDNTIISYGGDTLITAGTGADVITSSYGNDTIDVGAGNNQINAGGGNNLIITGSGDDAISTDWGMSRINAGGGNNTVTATGGDTVVTTGAGSDSITTSWGNDQINAGDGNNSISTGNGDDHVSAGSGNDQIGTDNGRDWVDAGDGNNTIRTGNDDDYVLAGSGADYIDTDNGRDIVQSGTGNDTIISGNDNDVVDAGAGNDTISAGYGDDWIAGGTGDDMMDGGMYSRNIFAFNKGDGADTISNSVWGSGTLSLGHGIKYADLQLIKNGDDLILDLDGVAGTSDSITLKDWYVDAQHKGVGRLQVITQGGDYDATSTDITCNQQIEQFDFALLVQRFDAARAADATQANGWTVMNGLLDAHLSGSDTQALGGDLSFQYASAGSLSGIDLSAAQASLASGVGLQTLQVRSQLERDMARLA